MAKKRSHTGNSTIKKEEEDVKPTVGPGIWKDRIWKLGSIGNTIVVKKLLISSNILTLLATLEFLALLWKLKTAFQFAVVLDNRLHCTLVLNGVNNTRSSGRIAKKRPPIANNRQLPARQVKVEEDIDTKSLLQSLLKPSKVPKSQNISQEQINQLSHYIVNDNMSIHKASIEVNISEHSGCKYFHNYINDPEKKIPSPLIRDT